MKKLTPYQENVINFLYETIKSVREGKFQIHIGFIHDCIRNYPEIAIDGKGSWQKIERYKKYHRISERAAKLLENGQYKDWRDFHYEHVIPASVTKKRILSLINKEDFQKSDVQEALSDSEVIILTKEEARVLDGSPNKTYLLEGHEVTGAGMKTSGTLEERLESIGASLSKKYINNNLFG